MANHRAHERAARPNPHVARHSALLESYTGRSVDSLSAAECRSLIAALGDVTDELGAGHDPHDAVIWRAILRDNGFDGPLLGG